ncbi:MAG: calcium/sodium antiporter [Mycoplasmatota bacterium]|nr:calcium/sodium antiporter [Mycoplasmatota bacterium]
MLELVFLIIGFFMIIKASDVLVDAASSIASKFHVPKMLIALTIVSFGTCAPEVAISFNSVIAKNGAMAFANVIGSCIVNVFFIIGLAALVKPIKVKHNTVKKELPILLLVTTSFSVLMLDSLFNSKNPNVFSRADGIVLILLFFMFVSYLIQLFRGRAIEEAEESVEIKYDNIFIAIILLVLSIIMICMSSDVIVDNATKLATAIGISEKVITMTAIVIGTSLPELMLTVSSAKKGEFDMTIGNIIGTNIFNVCIVLGLPIAIYGDIMLESFSIVDILVVFLTSFNLFFFARSERTISKKEGIIMLLIFAIYYAYLFI